MRVGSLDEGAWEDCRARDLIPEGFQEIEEGLIEDGDGRRLRGETIFNVPIGEPKYVEEILRNKAKEVAKVTMNYVNDLEEEYPQELWTMLHYSLQHRVVY